MKPKILFLALIICCFTFKSCAPVFSELQSARTVGQNRIEFTPSYSSVSSSSSQGTTEVQKHIGLQTAYGITPNVDIRARFEYLWLSYNNSFKNGIYVLGMGPKICFIKDRLSFYLPIGKAFDKDFNADSKTWELHPTLLFSIPVIKNKFEFNFSPKYLLMLNEGSDNLLAFNFGLALSDNFSKWAIRPEYGLLYNPGHSGHYSHFSIGFSLSFGK